MCQCWEESDRKGGWGRSWVYGDHVFVYMCEWLSVCVCMYWSSRYVNVLKTKRRKIEKARERGVKWKRRERETERKRETKRII